MSDPPKATPEQVKAFDAALENLDKAIVEAKLHPILKSVLVLMQNDEGSWWPGQLPMDRVNQIKALFDEAQKEKSLNQAILDCIKASTVIWKKPGGETVGLHLYALCENCIAEKNLLAQFKKDGEFAPGTLEKARESLAIKERPQPAKVGDKAPEGSLRVDQITPGGKRRL